jgi:hypothetical protein
LNEERELELFNAFVEKNLPELFEKHSNSNFFAKIIYDSMLGAWLGAKAQAVPETHLLVPKEPVEDVVIWLLCEKDIGDNLPQAEYFYKELVKKFVEASESGAEG